MPNVHISDTKVIPKKRFLACRVCSCSSCVAYLNIFRLDQILCCTILLHFINWYFADISYLYFFAFLELNQTQYGNKWLKFWCRDHWVKQSYLAKRMVKRKYWKKDQKHSQLKLGYRLVIQSTFIVTYPSGKVCIV